MLAILILPEVHTTAAPQIGSHIGHHLTIRDGSDSIDKDKVRQSFGAMICRQVCSGHLDKRLPAEQLRKKKTSCGC